MNIATGSFIRPKSGQSVSGDGCVVVQTEYGVLAAVIDGLGGGEQAAHPMRLGLAVLRDHADRPLKELIQRCHVAMNHTRGAVIGLLRLDSKQKQASYIGVGNIGIHVVSQRAIKPISKNGILGHGNLPTLLEMNYTFDSGDIFILYSDGISTRIISDPILTKTRFPASDSLDYIASDFVERYGKANDDVTVLIIKTSNTP